MSHALRIMHNLGFQPYPWQVEVLEGEHERLLLNCCRQAGKSTVVAILALTEALFGNESQILLLSPSFRQSTELFHTILRFYDRLKPPLQYRRSANGLELTNGSRIIPLPCKEETIRGYAGVKLLVIDEAARVYDDLYRAVRPMLAVRGSRLLLLSTPHGKQGFFHDAWVRGGDDWHRIEITGAQAGRFTPEYLEEQRRAMGEASYRQEYCCTFEVQEGQVYPGLAGCVVPLPAGGIPAGKRVGGIDFGYNSPFAAVWGVRDAGDVLWLEGEHFCRGQPLSHHARFLDKSVAWHCDPAGANERAELRCADFLVLKAVNSIRPGIAAVTARIQSARLRIIEGKCPNLLLEAGLYHYDPRQPLDETPVDEDNHALDALRYLIATIDIHRQARPPAGAESAPAGPRQPKEESWRQRWGGDEGWTVLR
jgi:hypothetical protein